MQGLLDRAAPISIEPRIIADVGSATGQGSRELARHWRRARVLSIDLSRRMLCAGRQGRGWFSRQRDVQADAHAMPFKDGSIDLLVANLSLPWFSRPETCLAEIGRVLRREGLFVFTTLGPDTLVEVRDAWREAEDQTDAGPHVHPFADMHDIGDALIRSGMTDPVLDVERIAITYEGPDALFRDLRQAGSTNLLAARRPGLTGKKRFERFTGALRNKASGRQLSITVELIFGHAWSAGTRRTPREFHVDASRIGRRKRNQ